MRGSTAKAAFVSTNSIVQGEQVGMLWKPLLDLDMQIIFAYKSFKWSNNAVKQAGVTCVIISFADKCVTYRKKLFHGDAWEYVEHISPYLTNNNACIIEGRKYHIGKVLPQMVYGNKPTDGGFLIFDEEGRRQLALSEEEEESFVRKFYGAQDFIQGLTRYCLWITEANVQRARKIPSIEARLQDVADFRKRSKASCTREYAETPHLFKQRTYKPTEAIIAPRVSSERRPYIPFGYVDENTVVSDSAFVIYDAEPWVFAIISSAMHMAWVRVACGRLETRIRYSAKLCYNTFPIRELTDEEKERLNETAYGILDTREKHTEMTLGDMYNPESMPGDLKRAHEENDRLVDSLYRNKPFFSEEERLECLFALYQHMTGERK